VIDIEAAQDGFTLGVDGRRLLAHTRRAPCVEIGVAETTVRPYRGSVKLRRRRAASIPLRTYKILESGSDFCALDFDGKIRMAVRLEGGRVRLSFSLYDASINLFRIRLAAWHDESIFGCGQRFDRLDLKGHRLRLWVDERGGSRGEAEHAWLHRRDHDSGGFPSPVFVSTRNYWCAVDSSAHVAFDFSRRASTLIEAWAVPKEIVMGFGVAAATPGAAVAAPGCTSAAALVGDMTGFLGRQPVPPTWVYDGAIIGIDGGLAELRRKAEAALASGSKVAAFHIKDWCGPCAHQGGGRAPRDWTWDRGAYPELPREIAAWRARGLRVLGSVAPMLDVGAPLHAEASSQGFCIKDADGRDYVLSGPPSRQVMLDLSNPGAFAWIKEVLRRELLGIGMSGWVAETGEGLPPDAVLASGEDPALAHNRWPVLWAKANREAIEESGRLGDCIFFLQSGWLGSTRHATAFWTGGGHEGGGRKDCLASAIPAGLSSGLSGVGFWHFDVGDPGPGAARRGASCLARRMEMAAFTPFFRGDDGAMAGPEPQLWSDKSSLAMLSRMTEIFAALKPYHIAVAAEYAEAGLPPVRHPWLHYEGESALRRLGMQYMYGRDLLVAPSVDGSDALTGLCLPEDGWVHLWSSREFRGGMVTVESPPGYPAVFYRSASRFASLFDAIRRTSRRL
jgi:alpha-glucosidase